jgi:hypothetical protein
MTLERVFVDRCGTATVSFVPDVDRAKPAFKLFSDQLFDEGFGGEEFSWSPTAHVKVAMIDCFYLNDKAALAECSASSSKTGHTVHHFRLCNKAMPMELLPENMSASNNNKLKEEAKQGCFYRRKSQRSSQKNGPSNSYERCWEWF